MMNPHIEVINDKLWAVRFSLLQWIKDIDYKPDPEIPMNEELVRISKEGITILNKDHKAYSLVKKFLPKLMKKSSKELSKELDRCALIANKQLSDYVYRLTVMLEIQRRKELKEMG